MLLSRRSARLIACTGALGVLGASAAHAGGAPYTSAYTRHDFAKCAARPSPHPDIVDIRVCEGLGGIKIIWTSEPDASSVEFSGAAADEGLDLGSFHEVRETIEWRGPQATGGVKPLAAIVHYDTGPSVGRLDVSRLVVYRVAPGRPSCVMAVVKSGNTNEIVRTIVDRHAAGFVCGKSAQILN